MGSFCREARVRMPCFWGSYATHAFSGYALWTLSRFGGVQKSLFFSVLASVLPKKKGKEGRGQQTHFPQSNRRNQKSEPLEPFHPETECTKIAHRRSLAIFAADEGIAGNSAARAIFTHFIRRRNRGLLATFFAEEIAHLGASKNRAIFWGAVKIAAAAAENRAILVHSAPKP